MHAADVDTWEPTGGRSPDGFAAVSRWFHGGFTGSVIFTATSLRPKKESAVMTKVITVRVVSNWREMRDHEVTICAARSPRDEAEV